MLKKLLNKLQDSYGYSRAESNAVLLLFGILLVTLVAPSILNKYWNSNSLIDKHRDSLDLALLADLELKLAEVHDYDLNSKSSTIRINEPIKKKLVQFDPNTANESELISLGFSSGQASRLIRYRNAGGKFKSPDDLSKLYGVPQTLIEELKPYTIIESSEEKAYKKSVRKASGPSYALTKIDINTADSSDLEALRGISAYTAARIIRYRERLGGFVDTLQFTEVWGVDSIWFSILCEQVEITKDFTPRKIKINHALKEELTSHPYIKGRQASIWIAYRSNRSKANGPEDLISSKAFDESAIRQLLPYLEFD